MSTWKIICSANNFFSSHCVSPLQLCSLDNLWDWTNNLSALYPALVNFPGLSLFRQVMERGRGSSYPSIRNKHVLVYWWSRKRALGVSLLFHLGIVTVVQASSLILQKRFVTLKALLLGWEIWFQILKYSYHLAPKLELEDLVLIY